MTITNQTDDVYATPSITVLGSLADLTKGVKESPRRHDLTNKEEVKLMNTTQNEEYSTPSIAVLGSLSDLTKGDTRPKMSWAQEDN